MEIAFKISLAIFFGITVIVVSIIISFVFFYKKFKDLAYRRQVLENQLTKEELKIIELSNLANNAIILTNEYILELLHKRQLLHSKIPSYIPRPPNNIQD